MFSDFPNPFDNQHCRTSESIVIKQLPLNFAADSEFVTLVS